MPGGRGHVLLALAAAAALSACASSPKVTEEPATAPPSAQAAALPSLPKPAEPLAESASTSVDPAKADAVVRKPSPLRPGVVLSAGARAAALPSATPRQLVGLPHADVQDLFGQPFLLKREGEAELWQYRAPNCVLDVFLYAGKDGSQRVTHAELRARRENAKASPGCYAQILNAPRPQPQQTATAKG